MILENGQKGRIHNAFLPITDGGAPLESLSRAAPRGEVKEGLPEEAGAL